MDFSTSSWLPFIFRSLLLFVLPLTILAVKGRQKIRFNALVEKIPGPKAWPLIGNPELMFYVNLSELFHYVCKTAHKKYGKIYRFWILDKPQVIVANARDAEKFLQGMQHHGKSLNYELFHSWLGEGLLTSKDDKWRVHRKILTPAFHFSILNEFIPILNRNSKILTEKLAESEEVKNGIDLNIVEHISLCALDIICESSMGSVINAQSSAKSPYVHAVNRLNTLIPERYFSATHRFNWVFKFTSMKRELDSLLKITDDFTNKVINERRQYLKSLENMDGSSESRDDTGKKRNFAFLDMLLNAQEKGEKFMSQADIRDQVSTFMFEGHDTVSTATSWALFMMGANPEIQREVVEELDLVFGDSGRAPTTSDLAELKLLERCIKETLRLYPSVPFYERYLREDAILEDGTVIPAGCNVSFMPYIIHRDPEYFPDPEKFDPDRFLPENTKSRHPYSYLPFSAGPRNCIGQKFALMEEKIVISTVLRSFRVEAAQEFAEPILQMGFVLKPKNGLHMRLFKREDFPKLRVK